MYGIPCCSFVEQWTVEKELDKCLLAGMFQNQMSLYILE